MTGSSGDNRWKQQREKILIAAGIFVIFFTVIVMPALDYDFHFEYLLAGLSLCGVGLAQIGDKK